MLPLQLNSEKKIKKMKRLTLILLLLIGMMPVFAQTEKSATEKQTIEKKASAEKKYAEIKFEKKTHNFGTFAADTALLHCEFKFTNTGNADLYIHQAFASCGCTAPEFPLNAIKPGESGVIKVEYNGMRKAPGNMRRSITLHTNAKEEMVKIYITGKMLPRDIEEVPVITVEEEIEEKK